MGVDMDTWVDVVAMEKRGPKTGVPFVIGEETLIPTYVKVSEKPNRRGECVTAVYSHRPFNPAGWYVEFHYVGGTERYRRFISSAEVAV